LHRILPLAIAVLAAAPSNALASTNTLIGLHDGGAFMAEPLLLAAGGVELAPSVSIWRVRSAAARELVPRLRRVGLVRYTQRERTLEPVAANVVPDPLTGSQWWRPTVGADQIEPPGPGVPVTVIDTGIDVTHPEFAGRPNVFPLNTQRVTDSDEDYHGTAVASVVGAPANGVGLVGIYPDAALRVYDADLRGRITDGELIAAIETAAAAGPGVINLSLGSPQFNRALQEAIYSAFKRGSLVVAASGNSREEGNPIHFPANMSHVLTVAATDRTNSPARFSSSSVGVDLAAPGVGIPVAVPTLFNRSGYETDDGTSFSAPMVSGATAWVWTVRADLNNTQIFEIMRWSARDAAVPGFDVDTGFGILDIPAALALAAPLPDPQEPNDDVALVKPGLLFKQGTPALTFPGRTHTSLRARVDVTEDPKDVYRTWIPAGKTLTVTLRGDDNVDLEVWTPTTQSVGEGGKARQRDRAGVSTKTGTRAEILQVKNTAKRGAYYYVDVFPARGIGGASYSLSVTTR
jgi:subtilisin family serine protease